MGPDGTALEIVEEVRHAYPDDAERQAQGGDPWLHTAEPADEAAFPSRGPVHEHGRLRGDEVRSPGVSAALITGSTALLELLVDDVGTSFAQLQDLDALADFERTGVAGRLAAGSPTSA